MKFQTSKIWDVIVIGGGPAGMMAAGRAAERGKSVLLLEKNTSLGKKLLITGGGRCNLTNNKPEIQTLVSSYKNSPKNLYSVFSQFGVEDTLNFFNSRGMPTKLEAEGRIFPASNKAESVWEVLNNFIKNEKVNIKTNASVTNILFDEETKLFRISTKAGEDVSKACIIATGGTSHPETGSTGDGFKWLKNLGHTIIGNSFALVPIAIKENWIKTLAGVTLQDIKVSILLDGKKQNSAKGKLLFTHFGLSGPTILNMSSKVGELLQYGEVTIELDLLPELDHGKLKLRLHEVLTADINKKIKNTLSNLIPSALVELVLELSNVNPDKANNSITKEERSSIIKVIKTLPMKVKGLLGADKAIVSAGGVKIDEIDFKTMKSKLVNNLYVVGDVLDIDRPSGGYSLQICWATGYVSGNNC